MAIGWMTSWKTKIDHTPKLWEEFTFPTLCGPSKFRVVEMRGNHCIVESGNLQGKITRDEDGDWYFKHMLIEKNMKRLATLTNAKPAKSPMNPNIGTKKVYK